jgi:hypothetical protein
MSYTIQLTNGNTLTELIDGTINQTATDLTLIGKNATGYGLYVNDNFIHLLENFANTSQPNNPIIGQLWFDTTQNRLKVYNGSQFVVSGGTLISGTVPSSLTTGDLWIDSASGQLYFNDGVANVLAGPIYSSAQGQSGFIVDSIIDTNKLAHTVTYLYNGGNLLGIFASEAFTPASAIGGFTGSIGIGFNVGSLTGVEFNVPVLTANNLLGQDGVTLFNSSSFVTTSGNSTISAGTLTVQNSAVNPALILGPGSNSEINVSPVLFQIQSNSSNQNFQISTLNSNGLNSALYVNAQNNFVGIFTGSPQYTLDVAGTINSSGAITTGTGLTTPTLSVTSTGNTPANANSTGTKGQIVWDANYIYVCTATNTWRRAALSSW